VVVFSIRMKRPESVAGRVWNLAQDGVALLVLVVLKLTGLVTWSWWWVLSPVWLGGVLLAAVLFALLALWVSGVRGSDAPRRRLAVLQSLSLWRGRRRARSWWRWRHSDQCRSGSCP